MNKFFVSGLMFLSGILWPVVTHTVPLKLSLEEMVKAADTIVVAKVIRVDPKPTNASQNTPITYRATLRAVDVIKGNVQNEVEVFYSDQWSFEVTLRPNVTYLLFLRKKGPGFHVVQGYGGSVVIENKLATGIFMDGEMGTQDAEQFILRARALNHSVGSRRSPPH